MRRFACFLLAIIFMLSFSSCGDKKEDDKVTTTETPTIISQGEVKSYAEKGEILGVDVKLSDSKQSILDRYNITSESETDLNSEDDSDHEQRNKVEVYEGNKLTSLTYNSNQFFIVNGKRDRGVAVIACASTAYNFDAGNCYSSDIINSLGKPNSTDVPADEDLFYLFGIPQNVKRLSYTFSNYRLDFILNDDLLCMTVLTDTNVYTKMGNSAVLTESQTTTLDEESQER